MKITVCLLLALLLALSLCACGDGGGGQTPTEPQGNATVELPRVVWEQTWVSNPENGEQKVKISPEGSCEIQGQERSYTVVTISDSEVVLDAEGIELHITLNPQGMSELHVGGNWDEHYVKRLEYWNIIFKSWTDENGECIEIFPAGISMSTGFYPEFYYDTYNDVIEVMVDGQVIYTIVNGYSQLRVTDVDGNETLYTREIEYADAPVIDDPGQDEPMDEALRLGRAYEKALNDINAAISGQLVCDDEGKEITDGPALAEYLYNQFVALGDFEDASDYLPFFKTRTETVTTEQWYSPVNGYEREYVHDLPDYDVFGRPDDETHLSSTFGIIYYFSGNRDVDLVHDENNAVTQVIITMTDGFGEVKGTCVADLEYNEWGQHISSHVAFVDEAGNDVRYTSTFEYDSEGQLIRVDIPYVVDGERYDYTYSYLYRYDEYGRCVLESMVTTIVDESWYAYGKKPGMKYVTEYFYDENGLVVRELTHSIDFIYAGGGDSEYVYTYDEEQRLVKEEKFTLTYDWNGYYDEYGFDKTGELQDEFNSDIFHPGVSSDEATLKDWFSREQPVDMSKWDWLLLARELQDVSTYTYSETTIMYIDLTPED